MIRVENLGKRYVIGHQAEGMAGHDTLRDRIADGAKSLVRRFTGRSEGSATREEFWALKDVSFEVKRGECVGIIGRNGAGKSTLLKVLSRITEPTTGRIELNGRVASLLEVGTGFHPELTGRENIYLNGAILGMSRREIKAKFDEIVDFAEVEKFLDTPVKRYSSGMYVRLAFAVGVHLNPEILIVDEVLSVGDAAFQKKCLTKMENFVKNDGKTVLFVSHNLGAVVKLCSNSIVLNEGIKIFNGSSYEGTQKFLFLLDKNQENDSKVNFYNRLIGPQFVMISDAWLQVGNEKVDSFFFGEENARLYILVSVLKEHRFSVEIVLRDAKNHPVAFSPSGLGKDQEFEAFKDEEKMIIDCQLPPLNLAQGIYYLDIMLAEPGIRFFDNIESAISFKLEGTAIGSRNWSFNQDTNQGCFLWNISYNIKSYTSFKTFKDEKQ